MPSHLSKHMQKIHGDTPYYATRQHLGIFKQMYSNHPCTAEEVASRQWMHHCDNLVAHIDKLERRIDLAQRVNRANFPGFINGVLNGEDPAHIWITKKTSLLDFIRTLEKQEKV